MALDALAIRCLSNELKNNLIDGRIDKIHQPEKDEILIQIRTYTKNFKLVISANASHPRLHFTDTSKQNPMTAPMFCMLMRKHIGSGKIAAIRQIDFERVIIFDIESYDEFGELTIKHLIVEIMGRHSNIILTTDDMKIIDSIKHIDFTVSSVRQVLPGFIYELPPQQDKIPFISNEINDIKLDYTQAAMRLDKAILNVVSGISPLTSREIVYSTFNRTDIMCGEIDEKGRDRLKNSIISFSQRWNNNEFKPCLIELINEKKIIEFSSVDILQYESLANIHYYETLNEVLDAFYSKRDNAERMKQKSADLIKLLNNNLERATKKMAIQQKTLKDSATKERHKVYGDLLTANLYKMNQGDKTVLVENYYEVDSPVVEITLSPMLTPSQNAQKYYKNYAKAKTAEVEAAKQLKNTKDEIDYLESTLVAVSSSENDVDINAIRAELVEQGYIKRVSMKKKGRKETSSKPMRYTSSDGFDIYVGKNNTQNDYLTLKFANSSDLWFHTKDIHGSHVIIKLGIDKEVPNSTILEAAKLAAYYSKARSSSQVPVDYTEVRNVKKPNGVKPGMVIYDYYNTVYVTPEDLINKEQ